MASHNVCASELQILEIRNYKTDCDKVIINIEVSVILEIYNW